jgi:ferredoxin
MGFNLNEKGRPVIDPETCVGCGQCVAICPDEVLSLEHGKAAAGPGEFLGCIACGHCTAVCPTGAVAVSGRGMTPEDRVELPPPGSRATADQLEALLIARRSIRHFTGQDVPCDVLDRIVRMASTAPMGIPPHEVGVVVFPGPRQVQQFSEESCESFARAARFLNPVVLALMRPLIGRAKYEAFRDFICPLLKMLPEARRQDRDLFTYSAPAALLFHVGPMGDPADCAIVATYAMLAAESLGLGSCMLGTATALTQDKPLKAKYGIPPENKVGVALILGYPAVEFRHALRRRLASVKYVQCPQVDAPGESGPFGAK